jgi:hypothetical protein
MRFSAGGVSPGSLDRLFSPFLRVIIPTMAKLTGHEIRKLARSIISANPGGIRAPL